ncbi:DUF502 domain-containing protein [Halorientalis salina]|uniref:DUF502 domain-containing protein n=1 Tax=Halorientalis salina TaxID=2932266 RepID=UPI0010AC0CC1|nr:DUF502 domain-containing protein [Halorientalis salina]
MSVGKVLRDSFIAGLALVAPLVVTVFVLQFLVNWLTTFIDPVVQETQLAQYTANIHIVAQVLALAIIVLTVVVLGYVAQRSFGKRVFGWVDRGVGLVPLVRTIYSSVRQVSNALMERSSRYESVVLVEYPREGLYSLGFVTGDSPAQVKETVDGDVYNVFVPKSPNPTGGNLIMAPEDQVYTLDMSVRRGVRLLVTTGMAERQEELAELRNEAGVSESRP